MNKSESNVVSIAALTQRFSGWKVPTAADFGALIALATLNYRPGGGLAGGDETGGDVGSVNPDAVKTAWHVIARDNSLTVTAAGIALKVATANCGLTLTKDGKLCRLNKSQDGSLTANTAALEVVGNAPLEVKEKVSVTLATVSGLVFTDGRFSLNVDDKTLTTDSHNVLVKCKTGGGLKIDPIDGTLTVDIETILKK